MNTFLEIETPKIETEIENLNRLITISKTEKGIQNLRKCPSMIDWTGKMWHIYTMEYYAAIKNDEFVSFVGT